MEEADDLDAMFDDLLGEMDHLSQSLSQAANTPGGDDAPQDAFSIGFTDLNVLKPESLNELEDNDLDALVADLGSKLLSQELSTDEGTKSHNQTSTSGTSQELKPSDALPAPTSHSPGAVKPSEPQTKSEKIQLALEKLKEAKMRKLIIKVLMSDNSSKVLMVDERQTVRAVLDVLFEKTHCDCSVDWSLCEMNPELQIERDFEDHESLVEPLSAWTRHSENKILFVSRPQKYMMFTEPQLFYMWKKTKASLSGMKSPAKELLIKENFGGSTQIVPDIEGMLYLKEDGKKIWKPRYFMLRASGIYYVPKGKSKSSTDLACFVHFDKFNIYMSSNYKQKYKAPTDFCFILKHPCIQKESPYIKFLCCDDEHTLLLWVTSIRIAKYGTNLYKNYQAAVKRASTRPTLQSAAHKDPSDTRFWNVDPSKVDNCLNKPPPNFLPPPPGCT